MRKCGGGTAQYVGAILITLILTVPFLALFIYLLIVDGGSGLDIALTYGGQPGLFGVTTGGESWNGKLVYIGGIVFFGALLLFFFCWIFLHGIPYIEYDQRRVIFHFSKKLQWIYAWDALPEALVEVTPVPRGEWLTLRYRDKQKKIAMYKSHQGYRELKQFMTQKGIFEAVRRKNRR